MKQLLFFLLSPSILLAQKNQGGYFSLRGGVALKDQLNKGIAHMSIGVSPNHIFGIGAGIGFIDFEKPYIPLTVDISFFGKPGKIAPVIIGSAGYGIYQYRTPYANQRGGFTGSLNIGVALPMKKYSKFFVTGGYAMYYFGGESTYTSTSGNDYRNESNVKMFTVTAGIKI